MAHGAIDKRNYIPSNDHGDKAPKLYVKIKLKGYKKSMRRIRKMHKEAKRLNKTLERTVELKKRMKGEV